MKRRYKVRFNLANGENFMKWQVKDVVTNEVNHYEPSEVTLSLSNCFLRNQPTTAKKIHEGAHKTVCAWVECDTVMVIHRLTKVTKGYHVHYNPRIMPNWNIDGNKVDGETFKNIFSSNRKLYLG